MSTEKNNPLPISTTEVPSIKIQKIRIHILNFKNFYDVISNMILQNKKQLVTYVNVHTLNIAQNDDHLRKAYEKSSITYCDGAGVLIGARFLGLYLPERMTSATFIHYFCQRWQNDGTRIFFLGGKPGVASKACEVLQKQYVGLQIAGHFHGYFHRNKSEEEKVISKIAHLRPDILFIGFGTPLQEHWALAQWDRLDAKIIWPIGALVDYLAGIVPRCPKWMEKWSLEWLFRLLIEPRRMFGRYVIGNPLFILRIFREKFFCL
jgi:N-acetylglucosaminyldiphosphoundecaprenol N-acetyl-beta-D-mannosaminyltransferase